MKRAAIAAAILAGSTILAGCGGDDEAGAAATAPSATTAAADPATCEVAYAALLEEALKAGAEELDSLDETNVPDACAGLTQPELEKIVRKVTDAAVKAALEDAASS